MAVLRQELDVLADVRTIELERIEAALPDDDVVAVARIPDERVVAGAELGVVVAVAADQGIVAVTAGDGVVAGPAIEREMEETGETIAGGDDVIAAAGIEDEILCRADVEKKRSRIDPIETHARSVGHNGERLGS